MHQQRNEIFPRKLTKDFHNVPKPINQYTKKTSLIHHNQSHLNEHSNPEYSHKTKITKYREPVLKKNHQIQISNKQWIEHPAKISQEVPDWWKGTKRYYKRGQFQRLKDQARESLTIDHELDIFNRRKFESIGSSIKSRVRRDPVISPKIGVEDRHFSKNRSDVTPKVGAIETRDYCVRMPTLKIGSNSYVDTYSVF